MTNYNERLDETLKDIIHIGYVSGYNQVAHEARIAPYNHIEPLPIDKAKQAITSLTKELVAEAKPTRSETQQGSVTVYGDLNERDLNIIDQFEQNLLKALETRE